MAVHTLVDLINTTYKTRREAEEGPFRRHLGGSMIGEKCERALYYNFRWFKRPDFDGRILRLFDRGHSEEFKNVALLRSIGIEVRAYSERLCLDEAMIALDSSKCPYIALPWDADWMDSGLTDVTQSEFHVTRAAAQGIKLNQWRISDVMGHFGGSLDGEGVADFPIIVSETYEHIPAGERFLLEFKTHNTKSFVLLSSEGVKSAKPVHYAQMQTYMFKRGLRFALYMAINKNDDDLYIEVLPVDEEFARTLIDKAKRVIHSKVVPNRIGKHPSWHECKFCDFANICHYGDTSKIDRNCRTCQHSVPVDDGQWHCGLWNATIPVDAVLAGCDSHKLITD